MVFDNFLSAHSIIENQKVSSQPLFITYANPCFKIISAAGWPQESPVILASAALSLFYTFNPNLEVLLKELSGHLNDIDMAEARQIVKDIEARIQKFRKASR